LLPVWVMERGRGGYGGGWRESRAKCECWEECWGRGTRLSIAGVGRPE